jgi:hypothetical protein
MNRVPGQIEHRVIEGEIVSVQYEEIPLQEISLDPENSRIRHLVSQQKQNGKPLSTSELRKIIWELPGVQELYVNVRDNGGLMEPIYVCADGRVVEGNCRLAVYLRLHESLQNDGRWKSIPAYRLPDDVTERQLAVLQGQFHVAGKTQWRAHEQAGHVRHMHLDLKMSSKEVAKSLGLQERVVTRLLKAHELMTKLILPQVKNGTGLEKFSYAEEFYKNKNLEEFRETPGSEKIFAELVVSGKLKRGADVRDLPKILKHPQAAKVLKNQGHEKALKVLGHSDPTADSAFFKKLQNTIDALKEMPIPEIDRLKREPRAKELLTDLFNAVKTAARVAGLVLK